MGDRDRHRDRERDRTRDKGDRDRDRDSVDDDHKETKKVVSDFVDGITKEQQEKQNENGEEVETTVVRRLSGNSLGSSPTFIPLEIIPETILCRLPVKSLLRFRCVYKSWNSLISKDLKFAKKHLRVSPKRQHLVTTARGWKAEELTIMSCPFDSLNLHSVFDSKSTQLDYSPVISRWTPDGLVASCDGILCFSINECQAVLYNPCIRKLQKLPYIDLPREEGSTHYTFGYDPFIDNYKVFVVVSDIYTDIDETQFKVHSYTLGTDSWKRIKGFSSKVPNGISKHGIFMRGTVNWLTVCAWNGSSGPIVSLHLGKESYQEISLPDLTDRPDRRCYKDRKELALYVMRECLCVFEIFQERWSDSFIDVWLMKEYGNKESWIKLIHLPFIANYAFCTDVIYISEDNNVLLVFGNYISTFKGGVYDFKNDTITIKCSKIQDNLDMVKSKMYIESLISP